MDLVRESEGKAEKFGVWLRKACCGEMNVSRARAAMGEEKEVFIVFGKG